MSVVPNIGLAPVESWPLEKIIPYPANHKKHPQKHVEALAASIASEGLNDPISVDADGVIISGHGRLMAATLLGWTHCPVRHLHMLTKAQADKLRIAANKTTSTEYDFDILQKELLRLTEAGEDLGSIGLDQRELDMMLGDIGEMDMSTLTDDLDSAVDAFETESKAAAKDAAEDEVAVAKAFGFKKVSAEFRKVATKFMGEIASKTGMTGAEALMAHMESVVGKA